MATNRFEQVTERQEDAVTLFLVKAEEGSRGYITCPAAIGHGAMAEDTVSAEMPAQEAFRAAVALANQIKAAIVVVDSDGVWPAEWGTLYHEDDTV